MMLLERFIAPFREPACDDPAGHSVGEQDPDGGWWCAGCSVLFRRQPSPAELN